MKENTSAVEFDSVLKYVELLRNVKTSWANNSRILRIKNAKFSGYCFYMKTNIKGDFRICINVPCKSLLSEGHNFVPTTYTIQ